MIYRIDYIAESFTLQFVLPFHLKKNKCLYHHCQVPAKKQREYIQFLYVCVCVLSIKLLVLIPHAQFSHYKFGENLNRYLTLSPKNDLFFFALRIFDLKLISYPPAKGFVCLFL